MPKGLLRVGIGAAIAVALYSLLGFWLAPVVALHLANQQLAALSTGPAHLRQIRFNPYTLEVELLGLRLGEPGNPQVGFEHLRANLQVDSLWRRQLHLATLDLQSPRVEVLIAADGSLNLSRLFKPSEPAAQSTEPDDTPFPVTVDLLTLRQGHVHFRDARAKAPVEFTYDALDFELRHLTTLPKGDAQMTLTARGPLAGKLRWSGRFGLFPFTSSGHLEVTEAPLETWWPYVQAAAPLKLERGKLSASLDYEVDMTRQAQVRVSKGSLNLSGLGLASTQGDPLLRLDTLKVEGATFDLAARRVALAGVTADKLETWASRGTDGQLNWQRLFASPAAEPTPSTTTAATPPASPWRITMAQAAISAARVHLADQAATPPVALELAPLNLRLEGYDSASTQPLSVRLDTGVGRQGQLKAEGTLGLQPVSAHLALSTKDIDLRVAQAYITPYMRLELRSGMLDSDLAVDLTNTAPLAFKVTGQVRVNQLHTLDTLKSRDFVRWVSLTLDGVDYEHDKGLNIAQVNLDQPYARFMINEDRTTNIDDMIVAQPQDASATPAPKGSDKRSQQARQKPSTEGKPLAVRIGGVRFNDGSANFADFSLTPNFATAIGQLNGSIGTLDNSKPLAARVDVKGRVDRYAPVTIEGSLMPFDPLSSLDISTQFRRMELTTLTPYSGKFAGYRIRKGRLDLDLHYRIEKGQLTAENNLVVDGLELGDKVESPDAVNLPLKLAIALLKDSHGRISLALPVSGDLNNPQFSVMPVVWQTLRNLLVRSVQAPFKLLGHLVPGGGNEDLGTIGFAPGSSELDAQAQADLLKVAAALGQKPELRLEVEGASAASSDGHLIAQQRLDREYRALYYKLLQQRGEKVPAQAAQLTVPESEKPALLEGIYRARLKQQPPGQWTSLSTDARQAKLQAAVVDSWRDSNTLLRQLGQARASSIKDFLVSQGKLSDERVYLIDARLGEATADGRVSSLLHLDVAQ